MKRNFFIFLIIINFSCSSSKNCIRENKNSETYEAARFGYFSMTLKLNSDSTYYYKSWNHQKALTVDYGKWKLVNKRFYLNSKKTETKTQLGKSRELLFKETEFIKGNDSIIIKSLEEIKNRSLKTYEVFRKIDKKNVA
jgi:hypothetical protein